VIEINIHYHQTPIGELIMGSVDEKLCLCDWRYRKMRMTIDGRILKETGGVFVEGFSNPIDQAITELDEYFKGSRKTFSVPLLLLGTDFQKKVWDEIMKIPFGQTDTYLGLAQKLQNQNLVRAVAAANGANALAIFVPCHRVIGTNGELTGYAGGLKAKQYLLNHEDLQRLF
jgi:methylated-DNA-[protein]-cysteine S-methyltransferase